MQIKGSDEVSRCNFGCKIDTDQYDHRVASITARDRFYILSRACTLFGGSKHQICRCQVSHSHQFDHDRIFDINRLYSGEIAIAIDDLEIQR